MQQKTWCTLLGSRLFIVFLFVFFWTNTAFAAVGGGDGDGFGADDLLLPISLIIGGLVVISLVVFVIKRRNTPPERLF